MLLSDLRLRFARDLVAHWMQIRRVGLVPYEEDIDPRALVGSFPFLTIADISQADAVHIELVGEAIKRRYGRDTRRANWLDFIPATNREAAETARHLVIRVPCGVYYKIKVWSDAMTAVAAETLALPLRRRGAELPDISIALTRDLFTNDLAAPSPPPGLEAVFAEFVDIGAGTPGAFPSLTPGAPPSEVNAARS